MYITTYRTKLYKQREQWLDYIKELNLKLYNTDQDDNVYLDTRQAICASNMSLASQ